MQRVVIIIYSWPYESNDSRKAFRNTPRINKPKISRDVSSHTKVKIESPLVAWVHKYECNERPDFIFGSPSTSWLMTAQ